MKEKKTVLRLLALLCALCLLFGLAGCGGGTDEPELSESDTTVPTTAAPTTTAAPKKTDYNRLTGLDNLSKDAKGKRPVAIMINNIRKSLPQYGIANADLMFECLVEGGITRMMAVFADYTKIPEVCSVRSCRYYFPYFAQGLDAVYICFGCNPTFGQKALNKTGIDYFDGSKNYDTTLFGRDPARLGKYAKEHTAFVKGPNIPDVFKSYKIRTDYKKDKDDYIFDFRKPKEVGKTACTDVRVNFSDSYYSTFKYDKDKKVYYKTHTGNPHMDSRANEQLHYTNVFILETEVGLYKNGPLVQMDWQGGTGYYISYGTMRKIKWSKPTFNDTIRVTDGKGNDIPVNRGNSYIAVTDNNTTVFPGK